MQFVTQQQTGGKICEDVLDTLNEKCDKTVGTV